MGDSVKVSSLGKCDFCERTSHYDAKMYTGPWAYLCEQHFRAWGVGLGTGRGQRLILDDGSDG